MWGCRVEGQKASCGFYLSHALSLSVHHGHLDCFHSDERGARWKCLDGLHVELELEVQLVSPAQTQTMGESPLTQPSSSCPGSLFVSGQKHRLGIMQRSYVSELKEHSQQKEGEDVLLFYLIYINLDCSSHAQRVLKAT